MRNLIFKIIRLSGMAWFFREILHKNGVTILCFHDQSPEHANAHFAALKKLYSIIELSAYVDWLYSKTSTKLPKKALIITIDDALKENYHLLPVFQRIGIKATIFACSSLVNTHRHYWWRFSPEAQTTNLEEVPDSVRLKRLQEYGFDESKDYADRQALSLKEMQKLAANVDFQSHTRFHPALPQCDDARAESEISNSKLELEHLLGQPVYAIAFPNGRYSEREIDLVKKSGYRSALTTDVGINNGNSDPYRLKRIDIPDDASIDELIVKASGAWWYLKKWADTLRQGKRDLSHH